MFALVYEVVAAIPRGRVATYGDVSLMLDRRLTPVGIGWALRACPTDLPWHRVVNTRGGLSTEATAPGAQRQRLLAEGVPFRADGTVDLERCRFGPLLSAARR